jgi:hypothetical protein
MPLHDWSRAPSSLFHDFHQTWSIHIKAALNAGLLPKGLSALVEQRAGDSIVRRTSKEIYASRANRIVVKHHLGRTVAVIEIVSPGNKDSRAALRDFVEKASDFLRKGIHLLVVDLFPPSPRDPLGIHKAIWDEIHEEEFQFPTGKDRILVAYETGNERVAYVEPVAVGEALPDMPLFLASGMHILVPLERTYQSTWDACPEDMQIAVETGVLPNPDADGD